MLSIHAVICYTTLSVDLPGTSKSLGNWKGRVLESCSRIQEFKPSMNGPTSETSSACSVCPDEPNILWCGANPPKTGHRDRIRYHE